MSLIGPTILTAASAALLLPVDPLIRWAGIHLPEDQLKVLEEITETVFALIAAWYVSRIVDVALWTMIERRTGVAAPKLLVAVGRLIILAATAAVVAKVVFNSQLTGVLVSSGAIGVVIGFALQRMISDFFSGIALSMEAPFQVGDWIEIDGLAGKVVETNWRATHLVTKEETTVIVPNSFIGERRFVNYDRPLQHFRTEIPVSLEYSIPIGDAKRVLLAAVKSTPGVLEKPAPDVLFKSFAEDGIIYRVRFFVRSYKDRDDIMDQVATSVGRHLWQAGFNIPYRKMDVHHAPMPPRDIDRRSNRAALLSRVELFRELEAEDLQLISQAMIERRCRVGDDVVQQGQPGNSLFVVVEGLLEARVQNNGSAKTVGRISAGEFFGEMSLLTGSPRTATVTASSDAVLYELPHHVMQTVLQRRPELVETISQHVAQRRVRNDQALAQSDTAQQERVQRTMSEELRARIRNFFGMGA